MVNCWVFFSPSLLVTILNKKLYKNKDYAYRNFDFIPPMWYTTVLYTYLLYE